MKTGLVLEGGAMRGMFTCGVLDIFMENGITFDGAAGISAGAVFGCNYKSNQIGRAIRYNKKYCADRRYCSLHSLFRTGDLYGADFCYREIPQTLDLFDKDAFRQNPMSFYVGATDVYTGRTVYHACTDSGENDILWMRASASMPVVSRPVDVDDLRLLDGGITDAVPYRYMEEQGYSKNVIILTQPAHYRKKRSKALPVIRLTLRRYPAIIAAMEKRHEMYNRQMEEIEQREKTGNIFVIRPPVQLKIGHREKHAKRLEEVYQIGRREAKCRLSALRAFLSDKE